MSDDDAIPHATVAQRLRKARLTPLRDLLRGRITGRLDWRARIQSAADLPEVTRRFVASVVRRTRLWPSEKLAVADELLAHFADAMGARVPPGKAIEAFGDGRRAVRLIRRAKLRQRGWIGRSVARAGQVARGATVIYAVLAVFCCIGGPAPRVDYLAIVNEPIRRLPESARAWPLYKQAILSLRADEADWPKVLDYNPQGAHWHEMAEWLEQHADGLELARRAAERPALGFVLGRGGSGDDPEMGWDQYRSGAQAKPSALNGSMLEPHWLYLSELQEVAQVLSLDARLAARRGDADRIERDVAAVLGLAHQLNGGAHLLRTAAAAVRVREVALERLGDVLAERPWMLRDEALARLARAMEGPRVVADIADVRSERFMLPDLVQRVYTPGGRSTLRGMWALDEIEGRCAEPDRRSMFLAPLLQLIEQPGGRVLADYERRMDGVQASLRVPLRESANAPALRPPVDVGTSALAPLARGLTVLRREVWYVFVPPFGPLAREGELSLGHSDGLRVGIALERYRRRNDGNYPATLDDLVPTYLAALPVDRVTAGPLHYRLVNGEPLVYSVGADGVDDGGRLFREWPEATANWGISPNDARRGDWVLYPWPGRSARSSDAWE